MMPQLLMNAGQTGPTAERQLLVATGLPDFTINGASGYGRTVALTYGGVTTAGVDLDANPLSTLQTAAEGLAGIGAGKITLTATTSGGWWALQVDFDVTLGNVSQMSAVMYEVEFTSSMASAVTTQAADGIAVPQIDTYVLGTPLKPRAGTWKPWGTTAVAWNATEAAVKTAIETDASATLASVVRSGDGIATNYSWVATWEDFNSHNDPDTQVDFTGLKAIIAIVPADSTGMEVSADLELFLPFSEGSGVDAADLSGNGNDGELQNGATWSSDVPTCVPVPSYSVALDGVNDVVTVPHVSALNAYPLAASVWFKVSSAPTYPGLLTKYAAGFNNGWQIYIVSGELFAWYFSDASNHTYPGGNGISGGTVADGTWHHAALVVDATSGRLYLDGVLTNSQAWTGTPAAPTTTADLQLGRYYDAYQAGYVARGRVHSAAWSLAEISRDAAVNAGVASATTPYSA